MFKKRISQIFNFLVTLLIIKLFLYFLIKIIDSYFINKNN